MFRLHAPRKKKGTASGSGPLVDRHCAGGGEMKRGENEWWARVQGALSEAVFSFLYLKKIKISKIYVRFGKFQKYTRSLYGGATGLKCNFFSNL